MNTAPIPVGTRVRVRPGLQAPTLKRAVVTVHAVHPGRLYPYEVRYDDGQLGLCAADEISPLKPPPPR